MCEVNPCGCTIITQEGRYRALGLIVDDRYNRLTEGGKRAVTPGLVYFDSTDFTTLMSLLGVRTAPEVLREVSDRARDRYCVPFGMKLELTEEPWTSRRAEGVNYGIVFAVA